MPEALAGGIKMAGMQSRGYEMVPAGSTDAEIDIWA